MEEIWDNKHNPQQFCSKEQEQTHYVRRALVTKKMNCKRTAVQSTCCLSVYVCERVWLIVTVELANVD